MLHDVLGRLASVAQLRDVRRPTTLSETVTLLKENSFTCMDLRQPGAQACPEGAARSERPSPVSRPLHTLATVPLILNEPAQNGEQA